MLLLVMVMMMMELACWHLSIDFTFESLNGGINPNNNDADNTWVPQLSKHN